MLRKLVARLSQSRTWVYTRSRAMATASIVQLELDQLSQCYHNVISNKSSTTVSALLQENHDQHHIFFNDEGFHNHIAHQMLTMWALNASSEQLQREYQHNKSYQRPMPALQNPVIESIQDPEKFISYLGAAQHYGDFLRFFQNRIHEMGWQETLQMYLFAGDKRAESMLVRMFAGFFHPLIHLGFGIEFQQPAIIAEALAQAACHSGWIGELLLPAERAARNRHSSRSIVQLLSDIRNDESLFQAVRWSDDNKIRDGILARAPERMVEYVSQVHIEPEPVQLEEKTAEMANAALYCAAGAQRNDRVVKFDFFLMHCVNCSIFFSTFLHQSWLSNADKARLLEWKIRMDLVMYASRRSPEIRLDAIRRYDPKQPSALDEIQSRVCSFEDDGHASKLIRAILHAREISEPFEDRDSFPVKRDDWLQMAHMVIDSVEMPGSNWVRSAGFDEAWADVPLKLDL